jgi:HNH endonuclease
MLLSPEGLEKVNQEIAKQLPPWDINEARRLERQRKNEEKEWMKREKHLARSRSSPIVRKPLREAIKKPHFDSDDVYINIQGKRVRLYRLIAQHFIGETEGLDVHHIDGDHKNNDPSNLCILSRRLHKNIHGR